MKVPFLITAIVLAAGALNAANVKLEPGTYGLDPAHSKIGFEIPHLVISTVEGRFTSYDGEIQVAPKFADSKVKTSINVASVDTSIKDRDDHLRSAEFFDVAKYEKMTFVSKKITGSPESFKIVGDLTIKGITKEVVLDAKYLGTAADAYGNTKAAFEANGKINRKDFGLAWSKMVEVGPVVGDKVTLQFKLQAAKSKK